MSTNPSPLKSPGRRVDVAVGVAVDVLAGVGVGVGVGGTNARYVTRPAAYAVPLMGLAMVQLARKLPCVETMLNCGLMRVVIPIGLSFVGNAVNGGVGLHPVARTAWKLPNAATSSSAGCDVRAVGPTMKLALLVPVLVATWSRGVTGSR